MSDRTKTGCDYLTHLVLMLAIINYKKEQIDYFETIINLTNV